MSARFAELTAALRPQQWAVLQALALEPKLAVSSLAPLLRPKAGESSLPIADWVESWVGQGLLVDVGHVRSHLLARSMTPERGIQIAPQWRALVLRSLGEHSVLRVRAESNQTVLGERSLSRFIAALYGGDEAELQRSLAALRFALPPQEEPPFARRMLWEAFCPAFDATWLTSTWGALAPKLATQALQDALATLEPADALAQWLASTPASAPLQLQVVSEYATLRGDLAWLAELRPQLSTPEQLSSAVAQSVLQGDFAIAQTRLDEALKWTGAKLQQLLCTPTVLAFSCLLAVGRDTADGALLVKRLLRGTPRAAVGVAGWPAGEQWPAVGRGVRRLLQFRADVEADLPRLDAHQVSDVMPAWEVLLLAHAVNAQSTAALTRRAWAERLERDAQRWQSYGYAWFAEQAAEVAAALRDLAPAESNAVSSEPRRSAAGVIALLPPPARWRAPLAALAAFAHGARTEPLGPRERLAWFVDLGRGELNKPSVEQYDPEDGWTRGRRLPLDAVFALRDALPVEDQFVLDRLMPFRGQPALEGEALDALCGHPRVYSGAHGRALVTVVRGRCRVHTRKDNGQWLLETEPRRLSAGVQAVADGDARLVVYRVSAALARLGDVLPGQLRLPEAAGTELRSVLAALADHVDVHDAEAAAGQIASASSLPCVRISTEAGAWFVEIGVRPFGDQGRFFPAGSGPRVVTRYQAGVPQDCERNLEEEQIKAEALLASCPALQPVDGESTPALEAHAFTFSEEEVLVFLGQLGQSAVAHTVEWQSARLSNTRVALSRPSLRCALRRTKGWYLVTGSVRLDDVTELSIAELAKLPFTKSGRFIRLPSGDFVELEARVRRTVSLLKAVGQAGVGQRELRIPEHSVGAIEALAALECLDVDDSVSESLARVREVNQTDYAVPAGLNAELRTYQVAGYQWLRRASELGFGACLADDMGLGKTIQVLASILARAGSGPTLVVAPTSVCSNWLLESARFAPSLRAADYAVGVRDEHLARCRPASDAALDVLVVSYALLQQDAARFADIEWDTVVLDEAQFIKNANSVRAKAAYRLQARCRVALSGTPVENHLGELWSIFRFLNPELLGGIKHFDTHYQKPVERDRNLERSEELRAVVRPYILRRTKSQVLAELPPITHIDHEVHLSHDEAVRYALLRRQVHEQLYSSGAQRQNKLQVLAELTRLRRFCCHPRLVFPEAAFGAAKVDAFLALAEELRQNGHRALVFSQFVDFLEIVRQELDERGFVYQYLHGGTPKAERQRQVDAFQEGKAELFLISLKAGGFGLNLTAADYAVHLDPWWNPASEAQATDRTHRIGQTRPVTVYRLLTKHTIEERVVELHREKRALADALLAGTHDAVPWSVADVERLVAG